MIVDDYESIARNHALLFCNSETLLNKKLHERLIFSQNLNLTEEQIAENELLWARENAYKIKRKSVAPVGLDGPVGSVGVKEPEVPSGFEFTETDLLNLNAA